MQGDVVIPEIDINWLEPERLSVNVVQAGAMPDVWNSAEVSTCSTG